MIRIGDRLLEIELDAFLRSVRDGALCFCSGERPANPNTPPAVDRTVAVVPIEAGTFVSDGHSAVVSPNVSGTAKREGRITYLALITVDRAVLLDVAVRVSTPEPHSPDADAYVQINRLDLLPGDRLTIEALALRFKPPAAA